MIHKLWNIIASKSLEPYLEIGLGHTVQSVFVLSFDVITCTSQLWHVGQ
jgi:hypothetical protein